MKFRKVGFVMAILSLSVLFSSFDGFDYDKAWKEVEKAISEGLPKTALTKVNEIYDRALNEKVIPQQIKATVFKTKLILQTEELGLETVVKDLEESIEKSEFPAKQILHSVAAELFQNYFQNHYYIISQRTNLGVADKNDIRTWAPNNYRDYISKHYHGSILERLRNEKTKNYKDLLQQVENVDFDKRPTLYELLVDRALNYFSNTRMQGMQPSFKFQMKEEQYLGSLTTFLSLDPDTKDEESQTYQAFRLFQQVLKNQKENDNLTALVDYDLMRLDFVRTKSSIKNANEIYLSTLKKMGAKTKSPYGHQYKFRIGSHYVNQKEYQKALAIYSEILDDKPTSTMKSQVQNSISQINQKSLQITTEIVVPSGDNFLAKVDHRNIDKACFKIVKVGDENIQDLLRNSPDQQISKIERLPIIKEWDRRDLKDGYGNHTYEEIIDGLPYGQYILIASNDSDYKNKKNAYVFSVFYVSDLAFKSYTLPEGQRINVRNRNTGKPVENAFIDTYHNEYDRSQRKQIRKKVSTYRTDQEGNVVIKKPGKNHSLVLVVRKGDDELDINSAIYMRDYRDNNQTYNRVEIFTDRAIYRPGQMVHFKMLAMHFDKDRVPTLKQNKILNATFRDANYQEISTLKLTTNDFGSTSGSFVIPNGLLTGTYTIQTENGNANIKVEEYKRPKFEVTIDDQKEKLKLGDKVGVSGLAKALAGNSIMDAKVTYTVVESQSYSWYRSWYRPQPQAQTQIASGEVTTDKDGKFSFSFDTEKKEGNNKNNPDYVYSISVSVTDVSGETRSTVQSITLSPLPYRYRMKLDQVMDIATLKEVKITAQNSVGENTNSKATIKIIELEQPKLWQKPRIWNNNIEQLIRFDEWNKRSIRMPYNPKSTMADYPEKKVVLEQEIDINDEGTTFDIAKHVAAGAYKIVVTSNDKYDGNAVEYENYVAVTNFDLGEYPTLNLVYKNNLNVKPKVGEAYKMKFGTPDNEVYINYFIIRNNKIIKAGEASIANDYTLEYTPSEKDKGGFTVIIDYIKHNYHNIETYQIPIPWDDKDLKLELLTMRDKVLPGSEEKWTIKISGYQGNKVTAEVLATMYDASLDQFINHDYKFNPFPTNSGYLQNQIFGFGQGRGGNLNYKWSSIDYKRIKEKFTPRLQGINRYNNRYADEMMVGSTRAESRVMKSMPTSATDGVRVKEVIEVEEANVVGYGIKANSADNDANFENVADTQAIENKSPDFAVRKNLNESVFFYPHLKTDKDGNVLLEFTMNEALTNWKLLTLAHDKQLRFGTFNHEVKTQKDVMIVPNSPRFFREGDRLVFPATVSNLSEKNQAINTELELVNPSTDESIAMLFGLKTSKKSIELKPGESARVDWTIEIPKNFKDLVKYRVKAWNDQHVDGEENLVPVVTNQTLVTESKVISLKPKETKTFLFDVINNKNGGTAIPHKYTLEYTGNPVWYAVQALPYLMDYPHRCTEQIFNRLYANTMASHIANANPKIKAVFDEWTALGSDALLSNLEKNESLKSAILEETPWVRQAKSETEQKKRIALLFDLNRMSNETKQYMEALKARQRPNGGFPWFPGGREDVFITQNIVEGIAHLRHLGIISPYDSTWEEILNNALIYLDEKSKERYDNLIERLEKYNGNLDDDHLDYLSSHYLYINSFFNRKIHSPYKKAYNYYFGQAEKHWLKKGLYTEAMLGLTLKRGKSNVYKDIQNSLTERSFFSEELGRYWNIGNGYNWYELPIESHAMMIEFFTEVGSDKDFVEDMKVWLLKNKQTNHWKTTKGTAAAIYALLVQGESGGISTWVEESNLPSITMTNQTLAINQKNAEAGTGYIKKTWNAEEINPSLGSITVQNNNNTIGWGAAYYQYFEDLDKVDNFQETPLKMTRTLYKETSTARGPKLEEIEESQIINPGDRVIARITIKVDRSMSYVHLKDMRGSGFEPENVLSGHRWKNGLGYYESTKDLASHFFISRLPKGTFVFEYPMRAVHKGEFSTGIATLQSMYAPEFTSHSEGGRIEIQ